MFREPLLVAFLKRWNSSQSVELTLGLVLTLFLGAVIFSGIRVHEDDTGWPVAVCILNVLSLSLLFADCWFFGFGRFESLLLVMLFDSVSTVGNIVMCFVGDLYLRALSSIMLIFSFSAKGIFISYLLSTILRIIIDLPARDGD